MSYNPYLAITSKVVIMDDINLSTETLQKKVNELIHKDGWYLIGVFQGALEENKWVIVWIGYIPPELRETLKKQPEGKKETFIGYRPEGDK